MATRLEIKYKDGTVSRFSNKFLKIPDEGEFQRTLHDFETFRFDYKPLSIALNYKKDRPDNALPDTVPTLGCKPGDFIPLTKDWQEFWFELLKEVAGAWMSESELLSAWGSLVADHRALTDRHAPENGFIDYIRHLNMGSKRGPMQIKCLSMGGNIVRVTNHLGKLIEVEALDITKPPPDSPRNMLKKHHLVHWATQSTVIQIRKGIYKVVPFPQLRVGGIKIGVPFPFVGVGGKNTFDRRLLTPIKSGSYYSPYVLAEDFE